MLIINRQNTAQNIVISNAKHSEKFYAHIVNLTNDEKQMIKENSALVLMRNKKNAKAEFSIILFRTYKHDFTSVNFYETKEYYRF